MSNKTRLLLITIVSLTSYHSGQQFIDWLRTACATHKLINLREAIDILKEVKALGLDSSMTMGEFAKLSYFNCRT